MAETIIKPKGLGISSPHCGSYLALIGERQDTSSVRRMVLQGAGSFLALPCGSGEIIGRQQLVGELLEFMGRAELAPVSGEHSLADLEQFVDLAALEQLGLDKPYTVDDQPNFHDVRNHAREVCRREQDQSMNERSQGILKTPTSQ